MRLRVIDYIGNAGGGVRFSFEVLRALAVTSPEIKVTLVSDGAALERYEDLLRELRSIEIERVRPPADMPISKAVRSVRGGGRVLKALGVDTFHVLVPPAALRHCDVAWFPWVHRHRLMAPSRVPIAGSFHDAIMLDRPDVVPAEAREDEWLTTKHWMDSKHRIVVSSRATLGTLQRLGLIADFGRCELSPVGTDHISADEPTGPLPDEWRWARRPFLLCPANIMPHKNHETLFAGLARSSIGMPLVLTGGGTELGASPRGTALRATAFDLGLRRDVDLIGMGYVDDGVYRAILQRASALVMPTTAEGGGSFPVLEAMASGIPVVCSRIPVLEEQLERTGGKVTWFDPNDADDLARALRAVSDHHEDARAAARAQRATLRMRSWAEVAASYAHIWTKAASSR